MTSEKSQDEIKEILADYERLKEENIRLKKLLGRPLEPGLKQDFQKKTTRSKISEPQSVYSGDEKIQIFRNLFRGREEVYAVRWIGKTGRSGYSPACANEWNKEFCVKPKLRCSECSNKKYLPLTDTVLYNHLSGKQTIGIYPLLPDETCYFLAVDFDKTTWKNDVEMFMTVCKEMDIPAVMERSRSGNGAHVWIFFEDKIPATIARKLGTIILTKALEKRYQIGFDSYDRFFPSQDTLPKGGFGNLIALPLQHTPREKGNSVFIDSNFEPYQDQWEYISKIKKIPFEQADEIVKRELKDGSLIGIRVVSDSEKQDDPWTMPPSGRLKEDRLNVLLPASIRIVMSNLLYIEKKGLPSKAIKKVLSYAAFQNPEFYKAQRMRLSTFSKPRIIYCGDDLSEYICLPRGCMDEVLEFFREHNVEVNIEDKRYNGNPIKAKFHGRLRPAQKKAVKALLENDIGILSAGTAFGKTVVGSYMISERKVNTLILVHRRQLVEQWVKNLSMFLNIPEKSIGQIGSGKNTLTGILDVGIIQSLFRKGVVKDFVADYGQIIVDECHHVSAFSFEQVLKQAKAKYVLGLTATPVRKDGHHPIIVMQCGPIRFRVTEKEEVLKRSFEHLVIPRYTNFNMTEIQDVPIQNIYLALAQDINRNEMIVKDMLEAFRNGCYPLLLTERTAQLEYFERRLNGLVKNIFVFRGGMGRKQSKELYERLLSLPDGEGRVVISTGRYIGEGFDDKRLDVLFLAMPVSWRGTLSQYVGRLHRLNDNKKKVTVYDYVDANVAALKNMYNKRIKGYKALGYKITEPVSFNSDTRNTGSGFENAYRALLGY